MNTNMSKVITLLQQTITLQQRAIELMENIESPSFPSSNGGGKVSSACKD